jgi:hypothetical protein
MATAQGNLVRELILLGTKISLKKAVRIWRLPEDRVYLESVLEFFGSRTTELKNQLVFSTSRMPMETNFR